MRRAFAVLALLTLPAVAAAQARPRSGAGGRPPSTPADPRGPDVFGGVSYMHAGEAGLKGWHLSGTVPFDGKLRGGSIRLVADLSGHYGTFGSADLGQVTFLAGPRLAWSRRRVTPFAQVLAGVSRARTSLPGAEPPLSVSDTDWGGAVGAGADYRLARRWAVRGQADLILVRGEGVSDANPRLSLGGVYRFGR